MALSEKKYITLCKTQIEKKFSFGNGEGYTQRDLELLSRYIMENTGVNISLSTLKRLWKDNYKQRPQIATLDALARVLDHRDWQEFKLQNKIPGKPTSLRPLRVLPVMAIALVILAVFLLNFRRGAMPAGIKIDGPIHFSANKTVTSGIPNTVIFSYDVSDVEADSFFIQQTWDERLKVAIDPQGSAFSSIYYESGYHQARLVANDSIIAMQAVHILSEGWEPHIYYNMDEGPVDLKKDTFLVDGQLHLSKELLARRHVDLSRYFYSRISNTREFKVPSDNFKLFSRIKADSIIDMLCPWLQVMVITEKHFFYVNLQNKGCEKNTRYKLGEIAKGGEHNDHSALGINAYEWLELGITVTDKKAEIHLNDKVALTETFREDFGDIVGLVYLFGGTGTIDHVKLTDAQGNMAFEDDFER